MRARTSVLESLVHVGLSSLQRLWISWSRFEATEDQSMHFGRLVRTEHCQLISSIKTSPQGFHVLMLEIT